MVRTVALARCSSQTRHRAVLPRSAGSRRGGGEHVTVELGMRDRPEVTASTAARTAASLSCAVERRQMVVQLGRRAVVGRAVVRLARRAALAPGVLHVSHRHSSTPSVLSRKRKRVQRHTHTHASHGDFTRAAPPAPLRRAQPADFASTRQAVAPRSGGRSQIVDKLSPPIWNNSVTSKPPSRYPRALRR